MQIRALWPTSDWTFQGTIVRLSKFARKNLETSGRLIATGEALTYGLVLSKHAWFWAVWVGSENYQRVRLDVA